MADLPITSDEGATPIVINDPTTTANVANVKAASTAAVAGDASLVVALSPNSPVPTGTNKIGVTGVTQGSTTSGQNGDLIQGAVTTAAPAYVTAQTSPLSLTTVGNLRVDGSSVTQPVNVTSTVNNTDKSGSGTITALNGTVVATTNGCSTVVFNMTGTWTATLTIQGTADGANWVGVLGLIPFDSITGTIGANSLVAIPCGGYSQVRLIATAFTSGTVNITWNAGSGNQAVQAYSLNAADLNASVVQTTSPWITEDKADATISSSVGTASGFAVGTSGLYNTVQPAPTSGQQVELQTDQSGNLLAFPGVQIKTGAAWSSATAINTLQYPTGTITIGAPLGCSAILVQLNQTTTLTGGAVTFQGTYDGTNWITIPTAQVVAPTQPWAPLTNPYSFVASTNQPFLILLQGFQQIRLNLTTVITGTGTVTPFWTLIPHTIQPILGSVSLGTTQGKSVVMKTGSLATTAVTANQTILTYTVTTGKTFYIEYLEMEAAQTTPSGGTSVLVGTMSFEISGTAMITNRPLGGGAIQTPVFHYTFSEPIPVASATTVSVVCTPAATTSFTWLANFGGYEK